MTDVQEAVEALERFLSSYNPRFLVTLAIPKSQYLTVEQTQSLWSLVEYHQNSMPNSVVETLSRRHNQHPDVTAFEDILDADPTSEADRLIYADWLDENGNPSLANAQRWMVVKQEFPFLKPMAGSVDFMWCLPAEMWQQKLPSVKLIDIGRTNFHADRPACESELARILAEIADTIAKDREALETLLHVIGMKQGRDGKFLHELQQTPQDQMFPSEARMRLWALIDHYRYILPPNTPTMQECDRMRKAMQFDHRWPNVKAPGISQSNIKH